MINFKLVNTSRTLAKHVTFESTFGSYAFRASTDLAKFEKRYIPVAARMNVYELKRGKYEYRGKLRVQKFDEKGRPADASLETEEGTSMPFSRDDLLGVLTTGMQNLKLI